MNPEQASLLDDLIDTDIAAIEAELQALQIAPATTEKKQKPKRTALPAEFPRTLIHQDRKSTRLNSSHSCATSMPSATWKKNNTIQQTVSYKSTNGTHLT